MQQVKAVVARSKGAPVELVTINVPDPGPGEALVKVQACGVCHTDLHYREGGINDDFPFLLGHEAAGVVEAVGPDVTGVAPGDFVILNWRAVCGSCRACDRGEPWYCFTTHNATQKMTLEDGTELSPALGIGAFAEKTLVAAGQCTKVDPSARRGGGRPARLRRDGRARRGDQHRRRRPAGKSVAVIGCGGVGVAAIAGRHARRRVTDHRRRHRRQEARRRPADGRDPHRRLVGHRPGRGDPGAAPAGYGADVVIEAVGRPETWKQAFYARDLAGTVVLVGVPTPDMKMPDLPLIDVFGRGGSLKSSWYGDCLPSRDFPMLVDLYQQGRLDLDAFVTEEIALDEVEAAFDRMHGGNVLRSVVIL